MDSIIAKEFDRCVDEGLCRSDVPGLRMKWIKGAKHLIAQYHPTWQLVKRKPFFKHPSLQEPFSTEAFNFTKVRDSEYLAKIFVSDDKIVFLSNDSQEIPESVKTIYTVLLNVSPICHNHQLIVPNLEKCYNQVWKDDLTIDLLNMAANSERSDYVLFFNSLGGFSSVNHLHFQVMYTSSFYATATSEPEPSLPANFSPNKLPVEFAEGRILRTFGSIEVSEITDWLCQMIKIRFCGEESFTHRDKDVMAKITNLVIRLCYEKEIPYDIIITNNGKEVYIFVRKYQQPLEDLCVNPACVELTGIVVYRSEETFNNAE